jgi:hypothetical protein
MGWEATFRDVMSRMTVTESDWKFVTSGSGELTVGTPVAHLGVNATGGAMWIKRASDTNETRLAFGGLGGSLGLSLIPFPGNFSFSLPQMPNAGTIYKLPFAGRTLSLRELQGAFVLMEVAADAGPGLSGALMFLGGSIIIATMVGAASAGTMQLPALIATSNGCVRFGGLTATLLPFNVGLSVYVGIIY